MKNQSKSSTYKTAMPGLVTGSGSHLVQAGQEDDQHGDGGDVLPTRHPVPAGPLSCHQFYVVTKPKQKYGVLFIMKLAKPENMPKQEYTVLYRQPEKNPETRQWQCPRQQYTH